MKLTVHIVDDIVRICYEDVEVVTKADLPEDSRSVIEYLYDHEIVHELIGELSNEV